MEFDGGMSVVAGFPSPLGDCLSITGGGSLLDNSIIKVSVPSRGLLIYNFRVGTPQIFRDIVSVPYRGLLIYNTIRQLSMK